MVIFGAAVRPDGSASPTLFRRTEAAFLCGGRDARYMPTGAAADTRPSEASVMAALLQGWGVPEAHVVQEATGTDTLSSAIACARLLQALPGPVRVATSRYHLRRCVWLLRILGVRATPCPPPAAAAGFYWTARDWAATVVDVPLALKARLSGVVPDRRGR